MSSDLQSRMDGDQSPAASGSVGPPRSVRGGAAAYECLQEDTRKWRMERIQNLQVCGKYFNLFLWFLFTTTTAAAHHCQRPWWFPLAPPGSKQQWCLPGEQSPGLAPRPQPPERWSSGSRWSEQDPVRERQNEMDIFSTLKDQYVALTTIV